MGASNNSWVRFCGPCMRDLVNFGIYIYICILGASDFGKLTYDLQSMPWDSRASLKKMKIGVHVGIIYMQGPIATKVLT